MKKKTIVQILLMVSTILVPMLLLAQPASSPYGGIEQDSDKVPLDGDLSLLVAAGVGYGAKKLKEKR